MSGYAIARRSLAPLGLAALVTLTALSHPATALAQTVPGGSAEAGCFLGICGDPGSWLRDLVPHIISDFLGGLLSGLGNLATAFYNDVNFLTRTPEALTYRNDLVRQFAAASQALGNGLLAAITLVAGFNIMLRPYLSATYAGFAEFFPRLLLGGILVNTAGWWCQFAIDVNNAACGVFGSGPPPTLADSLARFTMPFELLIGLTYIVMGLFLVLQQLMRLALVDVLLILAPLAAACWILPQTQAWARRWIGLFVGTVFAQTVLALTLSLGFNLAADLPPLTAAGVLLQPLLGIAVLALALKIPGLMGGGGGGGTIVSSLIGSAAGAAVGAGVGVGVRAALGVGTRVVSRTASQGASPAAVRNYRDGGPWDSSISRYPD